ncbi:MAG: RNA methyltransferase [Syntrophales bacterium]|nr:RNA methyltransferase [Syntrophales bacterium]
MKWRIKGVMENQVVMSNISVVLNHPKYPGNIGSAARCAKNMDVGEMIVVGPQEMEEEEIRRMATHAAADLVDSIRYVPTLRDALGPFQYVVGTTGRIGGSNLRRSMVSSMDLAETIAPVSRENRVALVFGSEDRGLTNKDLQLCNLLVTIPVAETFRSINLSHAVMIICYELFSYRGKDKPPSRSPRLASSDEVEAMYESLKEIFLKIDFINTKNPDYWMVAVRNLFSRTGLYSRDVKIIRGICRQVDLFGRGRTSGTAKEQKP